MIRVSAACPIAFLRLVLALQPNSQPTTAEGDYGDGAGDSKLTARMIERRLGCKGTARNMRSIARIVAKLDQLENTRP